MGIDEAIDKLKTHGIQIHEGQKRIVMPAEASFGLSVWSCIDRLKADGFLWIRSKKLKIKRSKKQ